jgi:hypothetical protein
MLNAKMMHTLAPPQAHRWHCILLSALSLSYAVAYSECHYAECHSGECYYAECRIFVLFCHVKLIYDECQNAAHCGATTDARMALHFSMSHQFDLCCNLFRMPLC